MEGAVVDGHGLGEGGAHAVRRQLGPVEAALDVDAPVRPGIDAHAQPHDVLVPPVSRRALGDALEDVGIVGAVRGVDHEGVRVAAADDAPVVVDDGPGLLPHPLEHLVAVGAAVALVDHMEVVDVDDDGVHEQVAVASIVLLRVAIEEVRVVQPRQHIALRLADDDPALGQLDGAAHPGHDDLRAGVRLGNEVGGALSEALHLRVPVRRQHDHRHAVQHPVGLEPAQDVHAVDIRQVQIQQDQTQRIQTL